MSREASIISLENYDENKEEIAKKIQNAGETIGFFYLYMHGLENELNTMLEYSRAMYVY
jgi:isopenicillin N synthase-like dioxygenase